jgi:colanic acid biosynthesis glycosyl transferase WcaI
VIAICPPLQNAVMPWLLKMLRGTPFVFHIQDFQVDAALGLGMLQTGGLRGALLRAEAFLLKQATKASTITEAMRKRLLAKGVPEDRTLLFPNWADISFITPRDRMNPMRATLGAGAEDVLVVYAGNMGEKQGLEIALDAAEQLAGDPRIRFALIGQGAKRPWLEAEAKRRGLANVRLFDVFPWEDVPDMLAAADIHLVIQRREAGDLVMPSKMTNIMAAGRATIATADPGTALHDVLTTEITGVATTPEDAAALAAAIVGLADEPARLAEMGRNARAYAERHIAKDAILGAFEARLRELAGK